MNLIKSMLKVPQDELLFLTDKVAITYGQSIDAISIVQKELALKYNVSPGAVVTVEGGLDPTSIITFIALILRKNIIVPIVQGEGNRKRRILSKAEYIATVDPDKGNVEIEGTGVEADSYYYKQLRKEKHPGLVVFTSGSTGEPKGIVHDLTKVLKKFDKPLRPYRMIPFLGFDHFGGINTILRALSSGSCFVITKDRKPHTILEAVEKHKVTLLPTTPSFLKYMMLTRAHVNFDLSSLELITYGSEMMESDILDSLHPIFPHTEFRQTYGLSELGVLPVKSRASDSLWVKVGGPGFETKVEDGTLRVKSESTMLGYLDGTEPHVIWGWYDTGDLVDVDGEYVRFRGRREE